MTRHYPAGIAMAGLIRGVVTVCIVGLAATPTLALPFRVPRPLEDPRLNSKLHGRVLDFTKNHGRDNRFWSPSLCTKRDMYVYVPPCYDESKQYPLLIWLHGFSQDEKSAKMLAGLFDAAVVDGRVPPMVIAVPDGTFRGTPSMTNSGSFYLNGPKGRYEDYLIDDVWNFLNCKFSIRPEREAHVLAGASMGGTSAFNLGFKHKEKFGVIVGIMPLLDLLYADCHGNHFGPFDPNCLGRKPVSGDPDPQRQSHAASHGESPPSGGTVAAREPGRIARSLRHSAGRIQNVHFLRCARSVQRLRRGPEFSAPRRPTRHHRRTRGQPRRASQ
jgi:poly(3-hydroxybutyrate) depolymerase